MEIPSKSIEQINPIRCHLEKDVTTKSGIFSSRKQAHIITLCNETGGTVFKIKIDANQERSGEIAEIIKTRLTDSISKDHVENFTTNQIKKIIDTSAGVPSREFIHITEVSQPLFAKLSNKLTSLLSIKNINDADMKPSIISSKHQTTSQSLSQLIDPLTKEASEEDMAYATKKGEGEASSQPREAESIGNKAPFSPEDEGAVKEHVVKPEKEGSETLFPEKEVTQTTVSQEANSPVKEAISIVDKIRDLNLEENNKDHETLINLSKLMQELIETCRLFDETTSQNIFQAICVGLSPPTILWLVDYIENYLPSPAELSTQEPSDVPEAPEELPPLSVVNAQRVLNLLQPLKAPEEEVPTVQGTKLLREREPISQGADSQVKKATVSQGADSQVKEAENILTEISNLDFKELSIVQKKRLQISMLDLEKRFNNINKEKIDDVFKEIFSNKLDNAFNLVFWAGKADCFKLQAFALKYCEEALQKKEESELFTTPEEEEPELSTIPEEEEEEAP